MVKTDVLMLLALGHAGRAPVTLGLMLIASNTEHSESFELREV